MSFGRPAHRVLRENKVALSLIENQKWLRELRVGFDLGLTFGS